MFRWCEVLPDAIELGADPDVFEDLGSVSVDFSALELNSAVAFGDEGCQDAEHC